VNDKPSVPPKHINVGQSSFEVTDPHFVQPVSADLITEVRLVGGVAAISFASFIFDGSGPPEARVCARLRVSLETLSDVQHAIEGMLNDAAKARQVAN